MSCVCILTPVVETAWPSFSEAVVAVAQGLGYAVQREGRSGWLKSTRSEAAPVTLTVERSEIVTDRLQRDQRIRIVRDGVTVTFARDERGRASLSVTGPGRTEAELRGLGEELGRRVVQQYVYQRILDEARARGFQVVAEEVGGDRSIRLKVRHWQG